MRSNQLVEYLKQKGPEEPQNVDKLLLRESMDVIGTLPASKTTSTTENNIPWYLNVSSRDYWPSAGEFGFQKQMGALDSLAEPASKYEQGLSDVDVLLGATHEVEARVAGPHRVFKFWDKQLWHGAYLLRRYQVHFVLPQGRIASISTYPSRQHERLKFDCNVQKQIAQLLAHIKRSDPRKGSFAQLLLSTKFHKNGEERA